MHRLGDLHRLGTSVPGQVGQTFALSRFEGFCVVRGAGVVVWFKPTSSHLCSASLLEMLRPSGMQPIIDSSQTSSLEVGG
jgi:hypothetical protein